jgi:two-component system response regulator EvgA
MNKRTQAPPLARRSVLLVDDNARVRATLAMLLRWSRGWEVVGEAEDGATACALAAARRPDLVLLDLSLPDGDGLSLLPRLRALDPPPRVVLLTGEPADLMRERALALGAAGYLEKTMPPDELLAKLDALVVAAPPKRQRR